jgi:hypothetical protein
MIINKYYGYLLTLLLSTGIKAAQIMIKATQDENKMSHIAIKVPDKTVYRQEPNKLYVKIGSPKGNLHNLERIIVEDSLSIPFGISIKAFNIQQQLIANEKIENPASDFGIQEIYNRTVSISKDVELTISTDSPHRKDYVNFLTNFLNHYNIYIITPTLNSKFVTWYDQLYMKFDAFKSWWSPKKIFAAVASSLAIAGGYYLYNKTKSVK